MFHRGQCDCSRCRRLPEPKRLGDKHGVAVVLYLDASSAWDLAYQYGGDDTFHREIASAVTAWQDAVGDHEDNG